MRIKRKRKHFIAVVVTMVLLMAGLTGCAGAISAAMDGTATPEHAAETVSETSAAGALTRPEGWTEESHSNETEPDYEVVFPDDKVNQITIAIAPEDWEAMQANMVDLFGEAGSGENNGGLPGGFQPPQGMPPQPGGLEPPEGAPP